MGRWEGGGGILVLKPYEAHNFGSLGRDYVCIYDLPTVFYITDTQTQALVSVRNI